MGLCTLGVSGGMPVTNQFGGVLLSVVGDYAMIQINNGAAPGGNDISGIFALSGSFINATIALQFLTNDASVGVPGNPPVYAAGNWQNWLGGSRSDSNTQIVAPFSPTNATALQINPGNISTLFAIRILLTAVQSGTSMLVTGNTNPGSIAGVDNAILAALLGSNSLNKAQVLGASILSDTDLMAAVGSSF